MQMQELQLKKQDLDLKAKKQAMDAAAKADQIRVEEARIEAQKEIAAMQVSATAAGKKDQLTRQQETEGVRMGIDAAKHRAQLATQLHTAQIQAAMQERNKKQQQKQTPKKGDK